MNKITRLAAAFVLSGLLLAVPAAQAAPALLGASANFELEVNEMELEITADDPRPKAYLYTGCSGITPPRVSFPSVPALPAPKSSWRSTISPAVTSVIWST